MEGRSEGGLGNAYRVNICGESLQLRSDQPPHMIEKVADYLDHKIREVSQNTVNGDKFRILALAAMNLSEELLHARKEMEAYHSLNQSMQQQAKDLNESLDRAISPKPTAKEA